jgi:hypothetical protein
LLPALGFAAAGAFGATALERGRAGIRGFAIGMFATGLAMSFAWTELAGLTGREPLLHVLLFATGSWALSFAVGGAVSAWTVGGQHVSRLTLAFSLGGALGALLFVSPSLLVPLGFLELPAPLRWLYSTASSVVGLVLPFAFGGAAAGRLLEDPETR